MGLRGKSGNRRLTTRSRLFVTASTVSIPAGVPGFGGTSYATAYGFNVDGKPAGVIYPAMGGLAQEKLKYNVCHRLRKRHLHAEPAFTGAIGTETPFSQ